MRQQFLFILAILICGCNNTASDNTSTNNLPPIKSSPKIFDKLVGTWKMDDGKTYERWTRLDSGRYKSEVFTIINNDTSWKEQAIIYQHDNHWIFENVVKDQNQGRAIQFTSSLLDDKTIQFSNLQHDFPHHVHYYLPDDQTIQAFIAGPDSKGSIDTIPFNYKRMN